MLASIDFIQYLRLLQFCFHVMHKRLLKAVEAIPLPLTEGACAPLMSKIHYLGMILDPRLPADSDITAVNQSAFRPESCGLSGVNPVMHVDQLCLHYTVRTTEGMTRPLDQPAHLAEQHRLSSGSGPQSQGAPHETGKVLWNTGGGRSGTEKVALLPPAMVAHLGSAVMPEMAPASDGEEVRPAPVSWERGTEIWERTWRAAQE